MPTIDGLTLVREYRALERRGTRRSSYSRPARTRHEARRVCRGANDYLVKLPDKIELTRVFAIIRRLI